MDDGLPVDGHLERRVWPPVVQFAKLRVSRLISGTEIRVKAELIDGEVASSPATEPAKDLDLNQAPTLTVRFPCMRLGRVTRMLGLMPEASGTYSLRLVLLSRLSGFLLRTMKGMSGNTPLILLS